MIGIIILNGELVINPIKIEKHVHGSKEIPSGYFTLPGAENISAVLFSASGYLSKFNRMGVQAGFRKENVRMIRSGTCYRHDLNASKPDLFQYEVDENSTETWGEGLNLYHNPNANYPVDPELFPGIAHHFCDESGYVSSAIPDFHPYSSITVNVRAID